MLVAELCRSTFQKLDTPLNQRPPIKYLRSSVTDGLIVFLLLLFLVVLPLVAYGFYYWYRKPNSQLSKWLKKSKAKCRWGGGGVINFLRVLWCHQCNVRAWSFNPEGIWQIWLDGALLKTDKKKIAQKKWWSHRHFYHIFYCEGGVTSVEEYHH